MDAFDPDAGSPMGRADRGSAAEHADFTARPARVKAGPLAAAVATVAILGATALPSAGPIRGLPQAPAKSVRALPAVGSVDLGAALGRFALGPDARLDELEDGGARLVAQLRSERDEGAGFELRLRFEEPAEPVGGKVFGPTGDRARPLLAPVSDPAARGFMRARGELSGTGTLAGHLLQLRLVPGSRVRRGMPGADGLTARFDALATQQPTGEPRAGDATADVAVRLMGTEPSPR